MNLPRVVAVRAAVVMTGLFILLTGCNSSAQSSTGKLRRPTPPVAGISTVQRDDAVKNRARALINEGKYTKWSDAQRAAEKDFPEVYEPNTADWSAEYARYRKQVESQEKFEADLAKMKRGS